MQNPEDNNQEFASGSLSSAVGAHTIVPPVEPVEIGSHDHVKRIALPPDWNLSQVDDEHLLPTPTRKRGSIRQDEVESFIAYILRHAIPDSTSIYCQADYTAGRVNFEAIINDHMGNHDGQQWRDYLVKFSPTFSEEWKRWTGSNKKPFSQLEFALFIEDNLDDIASKTEGMPTSQQILEMTTNFQANQDMRFKSAVRLQSGGVNMSFVQDDDAQTQELMKLFDKIAIGIPVFWNSQGYEIQARLRHRVREGKVIFWYELIRPDKSLEDATKDIIKKIKDQVDAPLYFGSPR